MQITQNISIRVALEKSFFHVIAARGGKHITASEISKVTGADELLTSESTDIDDRTLLIFNIVRIMRIITAIGLCDEVGPQTYSANEKTRFKILPGAIGAEKHQYDFCYSEVLVANNRQFRS